MTGQVKEDILSRFGELGVFVKEGKLQFNPKLLRGEEFLSEPKSFKYVAINNDVKTINLEAESICFTYCQVPIVYQLENKNGVLVSYNNNKVSEFDGLELDKTTSETVFKRTGDIDKIIVSLKK